MKNFLFLLLVIFTPLASYSVEPSEVLDDTVLEELARDISKDLRCLVCQNESIDESSATLAKDLRILVRERLVAGDNKDAVLKFIVDRYGEFVLLNPSSNGSNLILWLSGPLMLLIALIISFSFIKANQNSKRNKIIGLSDEEKRELEKIVREE
jgi:cytochrome c-type biogenesis protein CcmH